MTTDSPTQLERDARKLHEHGGVSTSDLAIGVIIGRTSEFFDFFVYAIASVIVFPSLVFPHLDALTGTMYSFAIFALAFVARPFGTLIFTEVDRAYGRGAKLTIALFLLGTSTVMVGFTPSYENFGAGAIWFLALCRIGQGLAWGGTWDGLASLLALNAPDGRRGWYAMIPQLGAPLGLIVASCLFAFFVGNLGVDDFLSWGWRYPFFVAFAINVVALFARLRMVVTPEYTELFKGRELQAAPVLTVLRSEKRTIVVGAFAPLASFAMFHMVTVFPLSYVFLFTNEGPTRFLLIEAVGAVFGLIAVIASGFIADQIGRRNLLVIGAVTIAVFSGFAPLLLSAGFAGEVFFMIIGFVILGISFGQSSGAVAGSFAKGNRYTASALTSDLAWLFGAGFAPLAALWLSNNFGLVSSGAYLLSGAVVTLVALWINKRQYSASKAEDPRALGE